MQINTDANVTGNVSHRMGLSQEIINNIGSVLNFSSSVEMRAIQDEHLKNDRNKIPMVFMMDVIHGFRTIFVILLSGSPTPALLLSVRAENRWYMKAKYPI